MKKVLYIKRNMFDIDGGPYLPLDGHHGGVYSHHYGGSSHFDSGHTSYGHGGHHINHIGYDDSPYHRPGSVYPRDDGKIQISDIYYFLMYIFYRLFNSSRYGVSST